MEMKNTYVELELIDGEKIQMTMNYYALYMLKANNKGLYDRYNQIIGKKQREDLDIITVLYTGYCCACILDKTEPMDEETFMQRIFPDRNETGEALTRLITPKRQHTVPASVSK